MKVSEGMSKQGVRLLVLLCLEEEYGETFMLNKLKKCKETNSWYSSKEIEELIEKQFKITDQIAEAV